jgi:di/tricarboxylate transporter
MAGPRLLTIAERFVEGRALLLSLLLVLLLLLELMLMLMKLKKKKRKKKKRKKKKKKKKKRKRVWKEWLMYLLAHLVFQTIQTKKISLPSPRCLKAPSPSMLLYLHAFWKGAPKLKFSLRLFEGKLILGM